MTAKRFNALIEELKLATQEDAAALLGIGRRSFVRYANNQQKPPAYIRRLLLCLVHGNTDAAMKSREW
jgi:hypothetical protein